MWLRNRCSNTIQSRRRLNTKRKRTKSISDINSNNQLLILSFLNILRHVLGDVVALNLICGHERHELVWYFKQNLFCQCPLRNCLAEPDKLNDITSTTRYLVLIPIQLVHVIKIIVTNSNDKNRARKARTLGNQMLCPVHIVDCTICDDQKNIVVLFILGAFTMSLKCFNYWTKISWTAKLD